MDTFRAMAVFVRVVERGSFSRAAADLGLSHGMASAIVKNLEARHGLEFLRRTTRRMALTEEGSRYFQRARRILDEVDDLHESLSQDKAEVRGRLVVQAPSAFSRIVLAPALGSFLAQHRHLKLTLLARDRYPDMVAEGIDVLIYVGTLPNSGLVGRSMGRFPIITVASPDYLARKGAPETSDELERFDLLDIISATTGRSLDWRFHVDGETRLKPIISNFQFESSESAIAAAIGGAGVLQNISYALSDHIATGQLKQLLSGLREPGPEIHVVMRKYIKTPARIRAFSSFVMQLTEERRRRDALILD